MQDVIESTQEPKPSRLPVNPIDLVILSLHPIVAIFAIMWIIRRRGKNQSNSVSNEIQNKSSGLSYEDFRNTTYRIAWILVITGFIANIVYSLRNEDVEIIQSIFPSGVGSLHAGGGIIGLLLLSYFKYRDSNKLTKPRDFPIKEERKSNSKYEIIMIIIILHAFLGFLWLLELIS